MTLFGRTWQTYTLLLMLACGLSAAIIWLRDRRGATADALLGALVGGVVGARLLHVMVHIAYFRYAASEAFQLTAGGLDWRGAVLGALLGVGVVARWRPIKLRHLFDGFALVLPIIALAAWAGCGAARCAYGAEVDTLSAYPALLVWEAEDIFGFLAPRFHTQQLGMIAAVGLFLLMLVVTGARLLHGRRLWLALGLWAAVMFGIGALRGDYEPVIAGLRAGQWLDLGVLLVAGAQFWRPVGLSDA